ncbi:MAG: RsmB/NOP family class I SAM-dependent RNA methyltransferase [Firmicutes bacterium]|nr:RsmB/NOP family class I SAM-dependent RNA methyltransferase [Bacillota bacterium]
MKLPEKFTDKMKILLKDEYDSYLASLDDTRYFGLRINTLKTEPADLIPKLPFSLTPVSWCKEGFYYSDDVRPAKHPYYNAGLYYIQEPSAMSTGSMIDIRPGDRVLDLCAAPGGKSTQAAAKLKGRGIIVSNDISASRCKALLKNIEISGVPNAVITNETPEKLANRFVGFFNKIIVDAPCSGEGMFRKDPEAVKSWDTHKTEMCITLQRQILSSADKMLSTGGTLAYSTCTFAPEEDEMMISEFLSLHDDYELIDIDKSLGFDSGRPEWASDCPQDLKKCARLWPHKIKGEGHFLALLRKKGTDDFLPSSSFSSICASDKNLSEYRKFMKEYMNSDITDNLELHNQSLMRIPMGIDLHGLRVMRSGLYIGDVKKNRFEPSQAFAMCLKKEEVKNVIDFAPTDENVIRYLKGESFSVDSAEGWVLVCIDGYPLGWGKVQNKRLKNKYLSSWKI